MKPKQDDEYGEGLLERFVDWMNRNDEKNRKKDWIKRGSVDRYGRKPGDPG